jgi:peptidyl-prolyl cis-trans isomerase SurA
MRDWQNRVEQAMTALDEGMEFASAAVNFSESPDALDGGQVGWRNLNTMPREIADAIRGLEPGQLSEPVLTGGNVLIVRVNDRRPRGEVIVDELKARHILIQPSELMSIDRARELAEELHQRIEAGEDFTELAREYSDDVRSANLGGLLDWFPEGAYGQTIQQICDSLEPGQYSQPFQTAQGWHILMLEDTRQADRTVESRRSEARNILMEQRADEEIERMLRQFRDEAFVEKLL